MLIEQFSQFGEVLEVEVLTGQSVSGDACAIVVMKTLEEAQIAINQLNGRRCFYPYSAKPITVRIKANSNSNNNNMSALSSTLSNMSLMPTIHHQQNSRRALNGLAKTLKNYGNASLSISSPAPSLGNSTQMSAVNDCNFANFYKHDTAVSPINYTAPVFSPVYDHPKFMLPDEMTALKTCIRPGLSPTQL